MFAFFGWTEKFCYGNLENSVRDEKFYRNFDKCYKAALGKTLFSSVDCKYLTIALINILYMYTRYVIQYK